MPIDPYDMEAVVPDWAELGAACLGGDSDPKWFDNDEELVNGKRSLLKLYDTNAKTVCATCPAVCHQECFEFHMQLSTSKDYGIRAGLDRKERLNIRHLVKKYANAS
jgi:hypothetical protein